MNPVFKSEFDKRARCVRQDPVGGSDSGGRAWRVNSVRKSGFGGLGACVRIRGGSGSVSRVARANPVITVESSRQVSVAYE